MRILAIRGENLASLAARFDIDLSAGPIGATGLFAITGETGAGKSTILDALCLALYGKYPRVAVRVLEDAPDPGGEPIGAKDGRAILRRGAGSGWAEVDFIGQDGVGYRARWEVFRARSRADGRLQKVERVLRRLDDKSAIESGRTAVAAAIEARTDLTFDQFRRTALLAQGEFDAFLLAGEGERSDLLEKITGTAVYSAISKRVYAGAEGHRAEVKALEARRDAIGLLGEEARAERAAERQAASAEAAALEAERAALRAALDHAARLAAARGLVAAAEARAAAALAAIESHREDAERLAELDAAEPLRAPAKDAAEASGALARAEAALATALAQRAAAEGRAALAAAARAPAQAAAEASEAGFKALGPVWDEAAKLDSQIEIAAADSEKALADSGESRRAALAAAEHRAEIGRRSAEAEAARADAAARLSADAGGAYLASRVEETAALFAERAALSGAMAEAGAALTTASAETARREALIATAETEIRTQREARKRAIALRDRRALALAAIGEAEIRGRAAILDRLIEWAREAEPLARRHAGAITSLSAAEEAARTEREAIAAARSAEQGAVRARAEAEAARREVAPLADLAQESLSAQAGHLRSLLIPGEPCPVCGAADHRLARDGLSALAETLKARRAGLDADLARATMAIDAASGMRARAEARLGEATRLAGEAGDALTETAGAYAPFAQALAEGCAGAGIAGQAPQALDAAAPGALTALVAEARAVRAPLADALDRADALRGEIDDLSRAIETAGAALDDAEAAIAVERDARQEAQVRAATESARVAGLAARVASLGQEIAPHLAAAGLSLADLDRDGAGAARRAETRAAAHRALGVRVGALTGEAQALIGKSERAEEAASGAAIACGKARAEAEARACRVATLRAERAPMLAGEATGAHRTRVNDARLAAVKAADDARKNESAAAAALAAAAATASACETGRDEARSLRDAAHAAFRDACGPLTPEAAATRLATPAPVRAALRLGVDARAAEGRDAEAALASRRADRDALLDRPEIDLAATRAADAAAAEAVARRQQRLGAIDSELLRDDAGRLRAAGLDAGIAAAGAELAIWEAVDQAVGSADGGKFRRFAQGVTLEHLVRLANAQLLALSPRYRLARGDPATLALHVIDRDMGDELRAARSLSGGERFLVSLALALALSGLEGRQSFVDTLFIDEGFGSLDAETLDLAVDALETLQGSGRKVGIITHVAAMIDRIAVQVRVEKRGNGRSVVRVTEAGVALG